MAVIRLWLAFVLLAAVPVAAQTPAADTRAAELAREQEEKSQRLTPYKQNPVERRFYEIEQAGGFAVVRGWFVTFGDIKQGSGIALGPAYGKLFDNGASLVGKVTYSIRNFKLVQLHAGAPTPSLMNRTGVTIAWPLTSVLVSE